MPGDDAWEREWARLLAGKRVSVVFDCDRAGQYDLACAELCGWGHYKMRGNVTVHPSQEHFDDWMKRATDAQNVSQLAAAGGVSGEVNPR